MLIQLRGGTEAEWSAKNPVLRRRECGVTTDTHLLKVGDGVTAWDDLPFAGSTDGVSVGEGDDPSDAPNGSLWYDTDATGPAPMLTVQRGQVSHAIMTNEVEVEFDEPFDTTPIVVASIEANAPFDACALTVYVDSPTTDGFSLSGSYVGSSFSISTVLKINWIAVA